MSEETHALLSPSSFGRRMACPGSFVLEKDEPDTENEYAKEGSLAHALAAHCLINKLDTEGFLFFNYKDKDEIIPSDMREHVQGYLDHIREKAEGNSLIVEERLEIEHFTGEKGAKGTADAIISSSDGKTMGVYDFKYGFRGVSAQRNAQLGLYGLAALRQFDMLGEPEKISLGIYQPRINNVDEDVLTIKEIRDFEKEVRETVKRVRAAEKSNSLTEFLNPGDDQCRYCKAAYKCPALAEQVAKTTGVDFTDETQTELIEPVDLSLAMTKEPLLETWAKAVRGKLEAELLSGKKIKGWKLVEGKKGNRSWSDEAEVEKTMKTLKLTADEMYDKSIYSVAKIEKKLKSKPKIWSELLKFVSQKQGGPSVAPASDPRPAYDPKTADDFEEIK